MKEKAQLVADLEEMDERLDALNRHMTNVSYQQKENLVIWKFVNCLVKRFLEKKTFPHFVMNYVFLFFFRN